MKPPNNKVEANWYEWDANAHACSGNAYATNNNSPQKKAYTNSSLPITWL